jgi:hypothetical protein
MLEFDKVLLEFVGGNWMSIYVVITLAKGLALITPTVKDDTIITLLYQIFGVVRGRGEPKLDAASKKQQEVVSPPAEKYISRPEDFMDDKF